MKDILIVDQGVVDVTLKKLATIKDEIPFDVSK